MLRLFFCRQQESFKQCDTNMLEDAKSPQWLLWVIQFLLAVVLMTGPITVTAANFNLTVQKTGAGTGLVTSNDTGINCGTTCVATYPSGTLVTLNAFPPEFMAFTSWGGSCTGSANSCQVTMDTAKTVTANFEPLFALTLTKTTLGGVDSDPAGIECDTGCKSQSVDFLKGTVVRLIAQLSTGILFKGWGGACSGTGSCSVTMNSAINVSATFVTSRTLTVTNLNPPGGAITSFPAGINCGITCIQDFEANSTVVLTATPLTGFTFAGWAGDCTGAATTCNVLMSGAKAVSANFKANQTIVFGPVPSPSIFVDGTGAVSATGGGSGNPVTFSSTTVGICTTGGTNGSTVAGKVVGKCEIAADQAGSDFFNPAPQVKQSFDIIPGITITVNNLNQAAGKVTSTPSGINCGLGFTDCIKKFGLGSGISLAPTVGGSNAFTGWSGPCHGISATCQVTADKDKTVLANFGAIRKDSLVIDFFANGIWLYKSNGAWSLINSASATQIVSANLDTVGVYDLAIDFGTPNGLWTYINDKDWTLINKASSTNLAAADLYGNGTSALAIDFGPGSGLWRFKDNSSAWTNLSTASTRTITPAYLNEENIQDLIVDFGSNGLLEWFMNAQWLPFAPALYSDVGVAADLDGNGRDDLVFSFGSNGIWSYIKSRSIPWAQLNAAPANALVVCDLDGNGLSDVVIAFGSNGLWAYMNNQNWAQLHPQSPSVMAAAYLDSNPQQDLVLDFAPNGIWFYLNNGTWKQFVAGPASRHIVAKPE